MRYKIRRIAPGSALRVGCALGWLVLLCPALCMAGVVVQALQRVNQTLGGITPFEITLLGQSIARIDLLEILRLSDTARTVAQLTRSQPLTLVALTLLFTAVGAVVLAVAVLLFSVGYNLLARAGGGLEVELGEGE
jgi:transmembrane protein DUF3566